MKKIVCLGGGNAMPKTVLRGLKVRKVKLATICSMADNGGSTGQLREDFSVLPAGDIRRHLLELSQAPLWKKELFNFRFGRELFSGGHKGHSFGTVFIAGLEHSLKNFNQVLEYVSEFLEVKGDVLPVTLDKTNIYAVLENNKIISGETNIDVPKHNPNLKIKKAYLKPEAKGNLAAIKAIKAANLIVIGPGDLYSSIIPCLLPQGISRAFQQTRAMKVFVCPAMTKSGETNNFSVLDFTEEIEKYLGCSLDFVIYNSFLPRKEDVKKYKGEHSELVSLVKINDNLDEEKFIGKNFLFKKGLIEYSPSKIARTLLNL
ncbi:YvcK family protein [Candidatus Parcubacteria bacterium]|nr:YvcK family protein [Candidatus Parcubacteria bacterium]